MQGWLRSFRSGVTPRYITPFPPSNDQECTIGAQVLAGYPLKKVTCMVLADGHTHRYPMKRLETADGYFDRYETVVAPAQMQPWRFYFQLETEAGYYFATRWGLQGFHPAESRAYMVDANLQTADWVPQATFYQIFPDRFRKSPTNHGVREGEYRFDDHPTKTREFGEPPLEYPDGWCLDFFNGDLQGILDSIPHFKELGITALYLNPLFSAKTNHRYDCTDFFHVDAHLGGDEGLTLLVEALHAVGIRCMVDVSINHTGIEHPWFLKAKQNPHSEEAGFYYRRPDGGFSFWADVHTLPQLNYSSEKLRDLIWRDGNSVVRRYLKAPFNIDSWRFDVGNEVGRNGSDQMCHSIWQEIRKAIKETRPDAYIIGEVWEDASAYLQGDQWDSAMNYFGSGRLLRRWYGQQETYLMKNWGHSDETGRPLSGIELAEAINQHLLSIPDQLVFQQFNLIDSHDTSRLHNHERIFDWDLYRGVVMLLFILPGTPSVYYGDEIGLEGHIANNEGARHSMRWNRSEWDQRFFTLYRDLGKLRQEHSCLGYGDFTTVQAEEETVVFSRGDGQDAIILILNRSQQEKQIIVDGTFLGLDSAVCWSTHENVLVDGHKYRFTLKPKQSELFLGQSLS
jgi:alpha-glucosidase